jgi:hypothetical protein
MNRPIKPIPLIGITPKPIVSKPPVFGWADPKTLLVEAEYQRDLSSRSIKLIRRIAEHFDWLHVKPPVCARSNGKLCVIDGQHTAITAASRGLPKIPVMIVEAREVERRAKAFVAHNTDRLNVTPVQLFVSRLAAGDKEALAAQRVAKGAGVRICRYQPGNGLWQVGDTMAVSGIERLATRYGEERATKVLKTLVAAKRAPVAIHEILAVAAILYDPKCGWQHSAFDLVTIIRSKSATGWSQPIIARMKSPSGNRSALWKAVAEAWVRAADRRST